MKTLQRGFSLIELMIVIAIIGILAAIAIPSYQTYVLKSKLGELLSASSAAQLAAAEYVQSSGQADCTNMPIVANGSAVNYWWGNDAGFFSYPSSSLVASVTVDSFCDIEVTGQANQWGANEGDTGQPLVIGTATVDGTGNMSWVCNVITNQDAIVPYAPSTCLATF